MNAVQYSKRVHASNATATADDTSAAAAARVARGLSNANDEDGIGPEW